MYIQQYEIYYADDDDNKYDDAISKVLALMDDRRHCNNIQLQQSTDGSGTLSTQLRIIDASKDEYCV